MNEFFPTIPTSDWSLMAIQAILGITADGKSATVMTTIWFWLNSAVCYVAGSWIIYIAIVTVVNSAHQGKVMGQAWSSVWTPLRVAFAIAIIAPMPPNGINAIQWTIYGAARMGISGANAVWTKTLNELGRKAVPIASTNSPSIESFARGYLIMQVCTAAANKYASESGSQADYIKEKTYTHAHFYAVNAEGSSHKGLYGPTCGGYKISQTDTTLADQEEKLLGTTKVLNGNWPMKQLIMNEHVSLLNAFTKAIQPVAVKLAAAGYDGTEMPGAADAAIVTRAVNDYQTGLTTRIAKLLEAHRQSADKNSKALLDEFVEGAGKSWAGAGAWLMRIADINGVILSAVNSVPTLQQPTLNGMTKEGAQPLVQRSIKAAGNWWDVQLSTQGNQDTLRRAYAAGTSDSWWSWIGLSDHLVKAFVVGESGNPIGDLVSFGHMLIAAFEAGVGLMAAMGGAANAAASTAEGFSIFGAVTGATAATGFLWGVVQTLTPLLVAALLALLTPGILLAYILPMQPFMYWTFAMAIWLQRFALALIAAPIWGAAHLASGGDGLIPENAKRGYVLLLEIILRPIVMVIMLYVGLAIMMLMGSFVNTYVYTAIRGALANNPDLFVGGIAMLFIVTSMYVSLCSMVFKPLATAPDQILEMAGFGSSGGGQEAASAAEAAKSGASAAGSKSQGVGTSFGKIEKAKRPEKDKGAQ